MRTSVRKATFAEAVDYYGQHMHHYLAEVGGRQVAMGTLTRAHGRLWGFLDVREELSPRERVAVVRALVFALRRLDETVYVVANDGVHKGAPRLLAAIGFTPTDELISDKQVWKWQS